MKQRHSPENAKQQAILLDLSLFILDMLDAKKIQENAAVRDHILEVPSALVLMLRDSRVGSPMLFLFIYSLLAKRILEYREKKVNDSRIARLANNLDYEVRGEAWKITQRLFDEFSSLIDIAPKATLPEDAAGVEQEHKSNHSDYPIRRYDSIGSFSHEDQIRLQEIYTHELNLPEHPLYDLYFSQIYHAQVMGVTEESNSPRKIVSLGDETFEIVARWKGKTKIEEKSQKHIIDAGREFLKWFIHTYVKKEWQEIVFDESLDLAVAGILVGSITGSLGVSLITLGGGTILKSVAEAPPEIIPPEWKPIIFVVASCLFFLCLIVMFKPTWFANKAQPSPSPLPPSSIPLSTPTVILLLQDPMPLIPSVTPTTPTTMMETLPVTTPFPINSVTVNNSPNYCLYVVQPGDTVQSIAAWFNISDTDIINNDTLVNRGIFTLHQLVRINAPCCTHVGTNNGFSYLVQRHDNVFRLATNHSTSVEKIVAANNLSNSRYIQAGQMLCIPYP